MGHHTRRGLFGLLAGTAVVPLIGPGSQVAASFASVDVGHRFFWIASDMQVWQYDAVAGKLRITA
jgi:hypothetical protein